MKGLDKRITFLALCGVFALVAPSHALAQDCTTVVNAGLVAEETWTKAGSPYCVTGDIQVSLLAIEAGVDVLVDGPYQIEVLSTIEAIGTEAEPIRFAAKLGASGAWHGLRFQSTPPGSKLIHCRVQDSVDGAIRLLNAFPPVIEDSVFANNSRTGNGGAIDVDGATGPFILRRCTLVNNAASVHGGALHLKTPSDQPFEIAETTFSGNSTNPGKATGQFVGGAVWIEAGTGTISQSSFFQNQSNAWVYGSCTLGSCSYPDTTGRGGAIYMTAGDVLLENSDVHDNFASATKVWPFCNLGGCGSAPHPANMLGGGIFVAAGDLEIRNSALACNKSDTAGGGLYISGGTVGVVNSTIARNVDATGIENNGGIVDVVSSILFFNNGDQAQVGGASTITYSDVEGGVTGTGNIDFQPVFTGTGCDSASLKIAAGSPAIDAGDPAAGLQDQCFPPSRDGVRNDMGLSGGPGACAGFPVTNATPTPTATPTPSRTPTPTRTSTPIATKTSSPTISATSTFVVTATPSPSPAATATCPPDGECVTGVGTVTTDTENDGATSTDSIESTVMAPADVPPAECATRIIEAPLRGPSDHGYQFLAQSIDIESCHGAATTPMTIVFDMHLSQMRSAQQNPLTLGIFREGRPVTTCVGAPGTAVPAPCLAKREILPGKPVLRFTILTDHASPWNVGNSLDAFLCRSAKASKGSAKLAPIATALDAGAGVHPLNALKPGAICKPAGLGGSDAADPETLLQAFTLKARKVCVNDGTKPCGGTEDCAGSDCIKPDSLTDAATRVVQTTLGTMTLKAAVPTTLLVPSAGEAGGETPAAPDPDAHNVASFACAKAKLAKGSLDPKGRALTVKEEATGEPVTLAVGTPTTFCSPVIIDGRAPVNSDSHLVCFKVKRAAKRCANAASLETPVLCKNETQCGGERGKTSYCVVQAKEEKVGRLGVAPTLGQGISLARDLGKTSELCVPALVE